MEREIKKIKEEIINDKIQGNILELKTWVSRNSS